MNWELLFGENKIDVITGRYLILEQIEPFLKKWNTNQKLEVIGHSVQNRPIYKLILGTGKIKIYMWSQMHGNESTTTKALLDLLNLLYSQTSLATSLLNNFTFCCIPMLNPDGAALYTRENANKVDLNRDSQELTQPESILLQKVFNEFQPHYCYNLHDQRTIFGVETTAKPATVSFLAPSFNEGRDMNDTRLQAINVIAAMNDVLQTLIPDQIGRFDDSFNINCIGDTFQNAGVPTILFEAGHYQNDYNREITRKYIFIAVLSGLVAISENVIDSKGLHKYLNIPQNKVVFYDFIYKNIKINYDGIEKITNFAAHYKEVLVDMTICFQAVIVEIGTLDGKFGHVEFDANCELFFDGSQNYPSLNKEANFCIGTIVFENGCKKSS